MKPAASKYVCQITDESWTEGSTCPSDVGTRPSSTTTLEASWNVPLDSPALDADGEWDELREQFSYERITGVVAPTLAAGHRRATSGGDLHFL
jgi:hypothetical protein